MNDLISRQAAIDALKRDEEYNEDIPNRADGVRDAIITISGLPSAQSEIIYCKDCTRYEKKNGRCNLVEGLNVATANSFCSYGEKK